MTEEELMEKLEIEAAASVHNDWCNAELKAYHDRLKKIYETQEEEKIKVSTFKEACFKNGKPRNEIELDTEYLKEHSIDVASALFDFDKFMELIKNGSIKVKRFTKRDLTPIEIKDAGDNYRNGEENILRSFKELSFASQIENLEAAKGAVKVYRELAKAGVRLEEMRTNNELRHLIGIAIHLDWVKRNLDYPNEDLKVPFDKLDDWTKGQDLTVFDAVLDTVGSKKEFFVVKEEGAIIPDYEALEREFFEQRKSYSKIKN